MPGKHYQLSYIPNHLDPHLNFCPRCLYGNRNCLPSHPLHLPIQPGFQTLFQRRIWTAAKEKLVHTGQGLVLEGMAHLETLIEVGKEDVFSILGLDGVLQLWF